MFVAAVLGAGFESFEKAGDAVAVPFFEGAAGGVDAGSAALVGQDGDLVDEVRVLRPAGGDMPALWSQTYSWLNQITTSSSHFHSSRRSAGWCRWAGPRGGAARPGCRSALLLLVTVHGEVQVAVGLAEFVAAGRWERLRRVVPVTPRRTLRSLGAARATARASAETVRSRRTLSSLPDFALLGEERSRRSCRRCSGAAGR